ncbi:MAG: trypsin-like peptidase domain-containing protein [Candidatus Omnitrophota bacterium]
MKRRPIITRLGAGLLCLSAALYSPAVFSAPAPNEVKPEAQTSTMLEEVQASIVDVQVNGRLSLYQTYTPSFVEQWISDFTESDVNPRRYTFFRSEGAGVIIDASGLVLTNLHVVSAFDDIQVKIVGNKTYKAALVGKSNKHDIALLRIEGVRDLKPVKWADSSQAKLADTIYAIGNPYAYSKTTTKGMISALDRQITLYDGTVFEHLIQTDVPVNPGNSGGALINAKGEMLGIVTLGDRRTHNIGFSVPTNVIRDILPDLKRPVFESQPYRDFMRRFGFSVQEMKDASGAAFLQVSDVERESEADRSGIRPNDVLLLFGDKRPDSIEELAREGANVGSGRTLYLRIQRDKTQFFTYLGAK